MEQKDAEEFLKGKWRVLRTGDHPINLISTTKAYMQRETKTIFISPDDLTWVLGQLARRRLGR
jgi:hypothetical protein